MTMNKRWPFKVRDVMDFFRMGDETPYIAVVRDNRTGEERAVGVMRDDNDEGDGWAYWRLSHQLSQHGDKGSRFGSLLYSNEYYSMTALLKSMLQRSDTDEYTVTWLKHPMTLEELDKLRETKEIE